MSIFWIAAAALTVLTLGLILPALLRKPEQSDDAAALDELNAKIFQSRMEELEKDLDTGVLSQEAFDTAKQDLEDELLYDLSGKGGAKESRGTGNIAAIVVGAGVPVIAVIMYLQIGSSDLIPKLANAAQVEADRQAAVSRAQSENNGQMPSVQEMLGALEQRLERNPDDAEGWFMLGRSYVIMRRYGDAVKAFGEAQRILPLDLDIMAAAAEAQALANSNIFEGEAIALLDKVLSIMPEHQRALNLRAFAHFQNKEFELAVQRWQALRSQYPADAKQVASIDEFIQNAVSAAAEEGIQLSNVSTPAAPVATANVVAPAEEAPVPQAAAADGVAVKVRVNLSGRLISKVSPGDTVFVFARAVNGPRMPLAIVRKQVSDLPFTVTLDDTMAMMPAAKLSGFKQVTIGARVSKSGQAIPQSGDLSGEVTPVSPAQAPEVEVVIDTPVP